LVLRLVEAGKLTVSDKTRRPAGATVRLIAEAIEDGDFYGEADECIGPIRAFAWPMLVQASGLAELRGSRLGLTKAGIKALGAEPASVIRTTWQRWLTTRILDELARRPDQGSDRQGQARTDGRRGQAPGDRRRAGGVPARTVGRGR
jgi:hypothetical protein